MGLSLLLHTLSTSAPVDGDCVVYWQNAPKLVSGSKARLIDATPLSLDQIWSSILPYDNVVLVGVDVLLPLKLASPYQILNFVRSLADEKTVTVVLNSDDSLRHGDHEVLLKTLAHSAEKMTALRALPSGRDREFAGMVRFTRGYNSGSKSSATETERLYKYQEDVMSVAS